MNSVPTEAKVDGGRMWPAMPLPWAAASYALDAAERWALFLDIMRQRSERYQEHTAKTVPHVLKFEFEPVMDGQKLPRPVNYALVRIKPPSGVELDKSPLGKGASITP